jgi:hypothetical protein
LEGSSSLPLLLQPACWLQDRNAMGIPASKLAGEESGSELPLSKVARP